MHNALPQLDSDSLCCKKLSLRINGTFSSSPLPYRFPSRDPTESSYHALQGSEIRSAEESRWTTRRGMEWRCPPSSQHHEKVDLLPPLFLAHYFTGNRTHRSDFPSFTSAHGRSSPSSLFAFALISGNEEGPALRDQAGMISHEVAMFCYPSACMTIEILCLSGGQPRAE